eukprot:scaffold288604_cov46-Prasinocladus_malaysianus.AAC.2
MVAGATRPTPVSTGMTGAENRWRGGCSLWQASYRYARNETGNQATPDLRQQKLQKLITEYYAYWTAT